MIPKVYTESIDLGDSRTITIETGKLAKQADGSAVIRMGLHGLRRRPRGLEALLDHAGVLHSQFSSAQIPLAHN